MLKKMLIHGLIAAAVIGGAAAVFASGRGDGYAMDNSAPAKHVDAGKTKDGNNGYITDGAGHGERHRYFWQEREDDHEREYERYDERSEHRRKHGERDED
tara:strand:- start:850 stop:1149 length:300 start_codon:yes stop_codon:yes gene_type:complete